MNDQRMDALFAVYNAKDWARVSMRDDDFRIKIELINDTSFKIVFQKVHVSIVDYKYENICTFTINKPSTFVDFYIKIETFLMSKQCLL